MNLRKSIVIKAFLAFIFSSSFAVAEHYSCSVVLSKKEGISDFIFDYSPFLKMKGETELLNALSSEKPEVDLSTLFSSDASKTDIFGFLIRAHQYFKSYGFIRNDRHKLVTIRQNIETLIKSEIEGSLKGEPLSRLVYVWTMGITNDLKIDAREALLLLDDLHQIDMSDLQESEFRFVLNHMMNLFRDRYPFHDIELALNLKEIFERYLDRKSIDPEQVKILNKIIFDKFHHRIKFINHWLMNHHEKVEILEVSFDELAHYFGYYNTASLAKLVRTLNQRSLTISIASSYKKRSQSDLDENGVSAFVYILQNYHGLGFSEDMSRSRVLFQSSFFNKEKDQKEAFDSLVEFFKLKRVKLSVADLAHTLKLTARSVHKESSSLVLLYGHIRDYLSKLNKEKNKLDASQTFVLGQKSRMKVYDADFYLGVLSLIDAIDWESFELDIDKLEAGLEGLSSQYLSEETLAVMVHEALSDFTNTELRVISFHYELFKLKKSSQDVSNQYSTHDIGMLKHSRAFFHIYTALQIMAMEQIYPTHEASKGLFSSSKVLRKELIKNHQERFDKLRFETVDQGLFLEILVLSSEISRLSQPEKIFFSYFKAQRLYERLLMQMTFNEDLDPRLITEYEKAVSSLSQSANKLKELSEVHDMNQVMDESTKKRFNDLLNRLIKNLKRVED